MVEMTRPPRIRATARMVPQTMPTSIATPVMSAVRFMPSARTGIDLPTDEKSKSYMVVSRSK